MRRRERAMRLVHRWARRVFALCRCSLRVSGLPHLHRQRCAIIVANHASYLDSVVLLAILRCDYRFIANRRELARPFVGLVLRKGGHLIVDRHSIQSREACGRAMLEALNQGTSLVLFPEGTRSWRRLQRFENGAFRAAVRTRRPIYSRRHCGNRRHAASAGTTASPCSHPRHDPAAHPSYGCVSECRPTSAANRSGDCRQPRRIMKRAPIR
jgi:1-acyl-sn-glycerol-3-phosphate acyltransferase